MWFASRCAGLGSSSRGGASIAFAVLVIVGSIQAGINWGAEGPRAGFFPFYISLFILVASMVNLFSAIMDMPRE